MGYPIRAVPSELALRALPERLAVMSPRRPSPADEIIAVSRRARSAWAPLRDIAYAVPGTIIVGLDGTTLRIRDDGGADEIGAVVCGQS